MSINSNPFHSTLVSIVLSDKEGQEKIDIMRQNEECEFHRMELESSLFDVFPSGTLIVRQKRDLITRLLNFKIDYIQFIQESGALVNFRIHSVSNLNNAASANEESYIAIHFTNYLYHYAQENSLFSLLQKPTELNRIDSFIKTLQTEMGKTVTQGLGSIDETNNYVLYRALNPKADGTEVVSDNIIEYINYLSSMAVPYDQGPYSSLGLIPRFLFWTDWDSNINFKVIAPLDLELKRNGELQVRRYAIYSGDTPEREINGQSYRKIYNYHTNQGAQFITKSYYYVRKTPKILDIQSTGQFAGSTGNTYYNLAYQFWPEGEKYNIELIGSKERIEDRSNANSFYTEGGINFAVRGAEELVPPPEWGYPNSFKSNSPKSISTFLDQRYNYYSSYKNFTMNNSNFFRGDNSGSGFVNSNFNYIDNPEMWKNVFDLTPVDPYYPFNRISTPNPSTSALATVLRVRRDMPTYYKNQEELIKKIEKQNFLTYALCCIGENSGDDESFYAVLTKYYSGAQLNAGTGFSNLNNQWFYEWRRLSFDGWNVNSPTAVAFNLRKFVNSTYWGGLTGGPPNASGDYNSSTQENLENLAINLNEVSNPNPLGYLSPGWAPLNAGQPGIKYRPIGISANSFDPNVGTISHIVKMYRISYRQIEEKYGNAETVTTFFEQNPEYEKKSLYYFTVENVVDGQCS